MPVRRLRKHVTHSLAHTDAASLHEFMARSDMAYWGIAPSEYVQDSRWAAVRERWWRYVFRRWALNDVVPGIPDRENRGANRGSLNLKVLRLLQEIGKHRTWGTMPERSACTPSWKFWVRISTPIHIAGNIVVPNLTPDQKAAVQKRARIIVKSTDTKAWEKRALMKLVRRAIEPP